MVIQRYCMLTDIPCTVTYYTLNDWSRGDIEIQGKQNSLFPEGTVIK